MSLLSGYGSFAGIVVFELKPHGFTHHLMDCSPLDIAMLHPRRRITILLFWIMVKTLATFG